MSWRERLAQHGRFMNPGDVIAFGGNSRFSQMIRFASGSEVSHAAVISHGIDGENGPWIYESSTREGGAAPAQGVAKNPLERVLSAYDGNIWWLPLRSGVPRQLPEFDIASFQACLKSFEGVGFDIIDGPRSVVRDLIERTLGTPEDPIVEDLDTFFCSELVSYALEKAGVLQRINSSKYSPKDLCGWRIYRDQCVLLKGDEGRAIDNFNTQEPPHDDDGDIDTVPEPTKVLMRVLRSPAMKAEAVADKILDKLSKKR